MITCETPSVASAEVIRGTVDVKAEGIGVERCNVDEWIKKSHSYGNLDREIG